MPENLSRYLPAFFLAAGAAMLPAIRTPDPTPLRLPIASVLPATFLGATFKDVPIGKDEVVKSGVSNYVNRMYMLSPDAPASLYVGYHATQQGQDNQMHSPSVCLPGSGWTPVADALTTIPVNGKSAQVNRFILQSNRQRILVYYWFQGRGRLTAGTNDLRINTMRDALINHRDEEALVRIIVPMPPQGQTTVANTGLPPDSVATRLALAVVDPLNRAFPAAP